MIKASVSRRSERYSPDGNKVEVHDYSDLETAIREICDITESDVKVSMASDNSNIVGLDVDFDIEIQDVELDEEGDETRVPKRQTGVNISS